MTSFGVSKSTDGGDSWNPAYTGSRVTALVIDPTRPSTLYVAPGRGVLKSTDGGSSWAAVNTGLQFGNTSVSALAIDDRTTPSTVYAGTYGGDRGGSGVIDAGIVYESTDGTTSWQAVNTGLPDNNSVTAVNNALNGCGSGQ